jgi:protein TonB
MQERHTECLLCRPSPLVEIIRYAIAATIVAALGSAVALTVIRYEPNGQVASDTEDAVMLDLPPAIDSSAPQRVVNAGPEQQAVQGAAPIAPAALEEAKPNPSASTLPDPKSEQPQDPSDQKLDAASATQPQAVVNPPLPEERQEDSKPDPVKTEDAPPPPPPAAGAAVQRETGVSGTLAPVQETEPLDSEPAHARAAKAISRWHRSMLARLHAAKSGMQTGGEIGSVEVGFTIDNAGAIVTSRITRGSGSVRLDKAALALVQRASPFPQPPAGLGGRDLSFKVPIVFARHN